VLGFVVLFTTSPQQTVQKIAGPKPLAAPNWHVLPLFHPISICRVRC